MNAVKVKVFVDHKPVGWLCENKVTLSYARATRFVDSDHALGAMTMLDTPDARGVGVKTVVPPVTFQLFKV